VLREVRRAAVRARELGEGVEGRALERAAPAAGPHGNARE
jgi:hypothetical protein